MRNAWQAWRLTGKLFTAQRKLWLPFLATAIVEALLLGLIWLAPHPPFAKLLAPPIRYFFGDRVLHYPAHLWFLFHAMKHTNLVASILSGAFMSGLACVMVQQAHQGDTPSLRAALVSKQVPYGRMLLVWAIAWGLARGVTALLMHYGPRTLWMFWAIIGCTFVLQTLLVYAIPSAVFERLIWRKALARGVRESLAHPLSTFGLIAVPSALLLVFAMLVTPTKVAHWMVGTEPEFALILVATRLALWTFADAVLTISIAHLWWVHRQPATVPAAAVGPQPQPQARPATPVGTIVASLVLCGLAATTLTGCSASYTGERLFWKAQQLGGRVLKSTKDATPERYATVIRAFERVIQKAPGTVWAPKAHLAIGALYLVQKQYQKARDSFALVLQNYNERQDLCLTARLATAKTFELEKNWDELVRVLRDVEAYHPWTMPGVDAPLTIAQIYRWRQHTEETAKAYEHAIRQYGKLILDAPSPEAAVQVKARLARAYQQLSRWDEALKTLQEIIDTPNASNRPVALMTLGAIYELKLHNLDEAKSAYTTLAKEFPDTPFGKSAQAQLERLSATVPGAAHLVSTPATPTPAASTP